MVQIPNSPRVGDMPKGEPIPEGVYHIRCDKAEYKVSKENKTPMAEVQFTVFGPAEAEEFHGRKLFENMMLAGEGQFKTRNYLEATGEGEDFVLEDTDQLLQRECAAVVVLQKERKDGDKTYPARNQIKRFLPLE